MPGRCMGTVKLTACGGGLNALSGVLRDASMTVPRAPGIMGSMREIMRT